MQKVAGDGPRDEGEQVGQMGSVGADGRFPLRGGAVSSGVLAICFNAVLIFWFFSVMENHYNDDFNLVWTVILKVLICLALVHIAFSLLHVYGVFWNVPELVVLWVIVYTSSCLVITSFFTIGLVLLSSAVFLWIIFFNCVFIFNIVMTYRFYKKMISNVNNGDV